MRLNYTTLNYTAGTYVELGPDSSAAIVYADAHVVLGGLAFIQASKYDV